MSREERQKIMKKRPSLSLIVLLMIYGLFAWMLGHYQGRKLIIKHVEKALSTQPTVRIPEMDELMMHAESALAEIKRFYNGVTAVASWYGYREHGRLTASGHPFDMTKDTAAHRTLPLGTIVLIENLKNGKMAIARVTDRGPYVHPRAIDVSYAIAKELDMVDDGLAVVKLTVLKKEEK
jgi:rare lipoprotein A (peptidoglycan hydrolase)